MIQLNSILKYIQEMIKKKKKIIKREPMTEVATGSVTDFKTYLKSENPQWFKMIEYNPTTVIKHYCQKHGITITKVEEKQFWKLLAELDSKFK